MMNNYLTILRRAGFFKEQSSLDDGTLIAFLKQKIRDNGVADFGQAYEPDMSADRLPFYDDNKMLDIDLEADVCAGNDVYIWLLQSLATISEEHFKPSEIIEEWASDEGPVTVSFVSNGVKIVFEAEYMNDWIDGSIFDIVNDEMRKVTEQSLVICSGPNNDWLGQNVVLIRLTPDEKALLKEQLGWRFPDEDGFEL